MNMTCGRGSSCSGQCSAIGGSLCPSGNCTGDSEDCEPILEEENPEGQSGMRSAATQSSSALRWCYPACHVRRHRQCCFHPVCYRAKRHVCRWLNYFTGQELNYSLKNSIRSFVQISLVLGPAAFRKETGRAKCRRCPSTEPLSWTGRHKPIQVDIPGYLNMWYCIYV